MPGHDRNQIQLIICNVTKNTLISVTIDAQSIMSGQDRNVINTLLQHPLAQLQCSRCDPDGDNITLARTTLLKIH